MHYNEERLHASLGYLTPAEYHRGDPTAQRAVELAKARGQHINETRLNAA